MTLPPSCLTVGMTHLSLYSSPGHHHTYLKPSEPNKLIFISSDHRTWFQYSMCFVDMSSANCLEAFLCIVFRRGFLLGWQPCTPIWCRVRNIVWALTGCPPPHLFNLCSNADRTPMPIFQRKHLDVMLSTCAQLLWTTYPWPVLSGPHSFKTLDDLSHCAAAQFQGVDNLLVALAIFVLCNNTSFKILREFFAMWCYVGTFSDQYERVWELHYKFEHTCSLCTWA